MSSLWVPEMKEPLLTEEVEFAMFEKIAADGLMQVASQGFYLIQEEHTPLGTYLDAFGEQLTLLSDEGDWPARALKIGASLTALAYRERGFYQEIDETAITTGALLADIGGIPETFITSTVTDPILLDFNTEVTRMDRLRDVSGGLTQVYNIGAGITRHYMQQVIAA